MMLKKHALCALTLLCSSPIFAAVPIESRGLSQPSAAAPYPATTAAALSAGAEVAVPTNLNWQIMQKNQQLENDIRSLRGKLEEQENEIEKLKNELNNRYADLDQRLELLQQKVEPPEEESKPEEEQQQDSSPSEANSNEHA